MVIMQWSTISVHIAVDLWTLCLLFLFPSLSRCMQTRNSHIYIYRYIWCHHIAHSILSFSATIDAWCSKITITAHNRPECFNFPIERKWYGKKQRQRMITGGRWNTRYAVATHLIYIFFSLVFFLSNHFNLWTLTSTCDALAACLVWFKV